MVARKKSTSKSVEAIVKEWLISRERSKKISRNTIAVGIVVLDHLRNQCPVEVSDLFSSGGELKGSRSGLPERLQRYGIPKKFLKEATTRQAHQDARVLVEMLEYGKNLALLDEKSKEGQLKQGLELLVSKAHEWLNKQPIKINCDRQQSPAMWVCSILEKAKGRSGGVVEQHLVGAKFTTEASESSYPKSSGTCC